MTTNNWQRIQKQLPAPVIKMLGSWFGVGYIPVGGGTWASLVGAGLAMMFFYEYPVLAFVATAVVTAVGFLVSGPMESFLKSKDPSEVVIDEVAGIFISFLALPMINGPIFWVTLFLFRAFDMFKVYPVDRFERLKGGVGIMMDDVVAGIYTNLIMQVAIRLYIHFI